MANATMTPLSDLLIALRFFSRLPVPSTRREIELGPTGLAAAVAMVPAAGLIIGAVAASALLLAQGFGVPPVLAAPLAIATLILVTGALHEDGLADCADGFGGGRTRERKLAIMRDSRIGTYGACAIGLSLYLRASALGVIASRDVGLAAAVLIAAAILSRVACLLPLIALLPARPDGTGVSVGQPAPRTVAMALALALVLSCGVLGLVARPAPIAFAIALSAIAALGMCALAWRQIGGQTGDVAGATQQLVEIAIYLVFAAA